MLAWVCIGTLCWLAVRKPKEERRIRNGIGLPAYRDATIPATKTYPCPGQIFCSDGRCVDSIFECGSVFHSPPSTGSSTIHRWVDEAGTVHAPTHRRVYRSLRRSYV